MSEESRKEKDTHYQTLFWIRRAMQRAVADCPPGNELSGLIGGLTTVKKYARGAAVLQVEGMIEAIKEIDARARSTATATATVTLPPGVQA